VNYLTYTNLYQQVPNYYSIFRMCESSNFLLQLDANVPSGVVNIVTGNRDHLIKILVQHEDVDSLWYFGSAEGSYHVEFESAANMKRTWVGYGLPRDTQVKNIWVPTGE
jgi:hypothetical protein